jgi:hypothetical protein
MKLSTTLILYVRFFVVFIVKSDIKRVALNYI